MRRGAAFAFALLVPARAGAECTFEHLEKIVAFHGTVISSERLPLVVEEAREEVVSERKASCPAGETDDACTQRLRPDLAEDLRVEVEISGAPEKYSMTVERKRGVDRRTFEVESPEAASAWMIAEQTAGRSWILIDMHRVHDAAGVRVARVRLLKPVVARRPVELGVRATFATKDPADIALRKLQATTDGALVLEEVRIDDKPRVDGGKFIHVVLRCPTRVLAP